MAVARNPSLSRSTPSPAPHCCKPLSQALCYIFFVSRPCVEYCRLQNRSATQNGAGGCGKTTNYVTDSAAWRPARFLCRCHIHIHIICMNIYIYIYLCTYISKHIYVNMERGRRARTPTPTHTHTHTINHTHAYTQRQTQRHLLDLDLSPFENHAHDVRTAHDSRLHATWSSCR